MIKSQNNIIEIQNQIRLDTDQHKARRNSQDEVGLAPVGV